MQKMFIMLIILSLMITACSSTKEQITDNPEKIVIYYFWSNGCPSCDLQTKFMQELEQEYEELEIKYFNLNEEESKIILEQLLEAYDERVITAPATFISDKAIIGFGYEETTGKIIEDEIKRCKQILCKNPADIIREKK
jgi:thiol-disulfide isomerase/thioredoxin